MKDTAGRDMFVGDIIIYAQQPGPKLYFGRIDRLNENTKKLWIFHLEYDRTPLMKRKFDRVAGRWSETELEEVGVSLVNHSDEDRFYVL